MSTATLLLVDAEKVDLLTAALNRVADNQDRLLAGQAAALEKIDAAKPTRAPRKPKGESAPAAAQEPAAEEEHIGSYLPTIADIDAFKTYVGAWTNQVEGADRAARVDFLKSVAQHFGGTGFSGAFAGGTQAVFFIERAKELGIKAVNFSADYDFDGDPKQDGGAASSSDDDFG